MFLKLQHLIDLKEIQRALSLYDVETCVYYTSFMELPKAARFIDLINIKAVYVTRMGTRTHS